MSRHFVILVDEPPAEMTAAITEIVKGKAWWHWIEGSWLVYDPTDTFTVTNLRDRLRQVVAGRNHLVLQVDPVTWSGFGPSSGDRNMFNWIKRNWTQSRPR